MHPDARSNDDHYLDAKTSFKILLGHPFLKPTFGFYDM